MQSTGVIAIWRFEKAPRKYRALHKAFAPEWVAHIPCGVRADEFEAIADRISSGRLERRTLGDGGLVYFGSSSDRMVLAPTESDSTEVAETVR